MEVPHCLHEYRVNTGAPQPKRKAKPLFVQVLSQTAAEALCPPSKANMNTLSLIRGKI